LASNSRESDKLPTVMEEIKLANKDVENCLDDLKHYSFEGDSAMFSAID